MASRVLAASLVIVLATSMSAHTQGESTSSEVPAPAAREQPCTAPEFRRFDFWVGTWEVANGEGKVVGRNRISREQLGCVLVERWEAVSGGTGLSMNYYDPSLQRWTQHWVGLGTLLTMTGNWQGEAMVLEGPLQYLAQRRTTILRGTWTPLPDGRVRQHFVESADGGKTWTEWFDGYYRRASF